MISMSHVARMGHMKCKYTILSENSKRKVRLGRHWRRWEDNIKMDFKSIESERVNCTYVTRDSVPCRLL